MDPPTLKEFITAAAGAGDAAHACVAGEVVPAIVANGVVFAVKNDTMENMGKNDTRATHTMAIHTNEHTLKLANRVGHSHRMRIYSAPMLTQLQR